MCVECRCWKYLRFWLWEGNMKFNYIWALCDKLKTVKPQNSPKNHSNRSKKIKACTTSNYFSSSLVQRRQNTINYMGSSRAVIQILIRMTTGCINLHKLNSLLIVCCPMFMSSGCQLILFIVNYLLARQTELLCFIFN